MIAGHVPAVAFLLATRAASWLRLSRREEAWKTAEILILRHQLTVLQRHQPCRPKLTWADRALLGDPAQRDTESASLGVQAWLRAYPRRPGGAALTQARRLDGAAAVRLPLDSGQDKPDGGADDSIDIPVHRGERRCQ